MKRWLCYLICALWLGLPFTSFAAPVNKIVGVAGDATGSPAPIPLSMSLLCDGTGVILDCPQYFAPDWVDATGSRFFGITNRTNPPRCVQSTNGGSIWGLCPSNPFVAAVDSFGAFMTVASDGSLIVAANQGANECIIRRSTDYGVSWTTVFTDTTVNDRCDVGFGSPTPSVLRCASANPYCVIIGFRSGTFDMIPYFSTDNGASWTKSATFNIASTDANFTFQVSSDGSLGLGGRYAQTYGAATGILVEKVGNGWVVTTALPLPVGAGPATRCTAGYTILGGTRIAICGPDSLNINTYRRFNVAGGSPIHTSSFTLQNAPASANAPDLMAVGFNASTAYVIGRNLASTQVLGYVTRDGFTTAPLIATLTPATALIGGCCRGDIHVFSGKIYFSNGAPGSNAFFGRIQ